MAKPEYLFGGAFASAVILAIVNKKHVSKKKTNEKISKSSLGREFSDFGSEGFVSCFGNLTVDDDARIRKEVVEFCENFDPQSWFDFPICTILNGEHLDSGNLFDTCDPFEKINGQLRHATSEEVKRVIEHLKTYKPPVLDLREPIRRIEQRLISVHCGLLGGNQTLDFLKQDPVTEITEWAEACQVEQRLADLLWNQELRNQVSIARNPAIVLCVCNFSNFLDLSRKVLRNLELGVPVIIFSRENTGQHMFRWTKLLIDELKLENIDLGMVTFLSSTRAHHTKVMKAVPNSPAYLTGRRVAAKQIKQILPKLIASTGGPNTMIVDGEMTQSIAEAACLSVGIENSGQCTAMRHLITAPGNYDLNKVLDIQMSKNATESVSNGVFGNILQESEFELHDTYTKFQNEPKGYRINGALPKILIENWRNIYLDVTEMNTQNVKAISSWLNIHQPITLAVNAPETPYQLMKDIFEHTALVVYTVGCAESPAYTCQARPQEGECFGEFPPRKTFLEHTRFPVIVPSCTPGYDTEYTEQFLVSNSKLPFPIPCGQDFANEIENPLLRGYCQIIGEYILNSSGPNIGTGARTCLFGLQRPPLGTTTVIRLSDLDKGLVYLLCFVCTNAYSCLRVSCPTSIERDFLTDLGMPNCVEETEEAYQKFVADERNNVWNAVVATLDDFPLVGHFLGTLFPLGHIKSTKQNDKEFLTIFSDSDKWLSTRETGI